MLDTNVLVKFAFIYRKEDAKVSLPVSLKKFKKVLDFYESAKFTNVLSSWSKLELRDVLMKLKLSEIYFLNGYSVREFSDAKREGIKLEPANIDGVNAIVFGIWKFSERSTKRMDMRKIEHFTKKGFSSSDMILLHQAELNKCDYFVTEDEELRFSEDLRNNFNVKICCVNDLLSELESKP